MAVGEGQLRPTGQMLRRLVDLPQHLALSAEAAGFEPARGYKPSTRLAGLRIGVCQDAARSASRSRRPAQAPLYVCARGRTRPELRPTPCLQRTGSSLQEHRFRLDSHRWKSVNKLDSVAVAAVSRGSVSCDLCLIRSTRWAWIAGPKRARDPRWSRRVAGGLSR